MTTIHIQPGEFWVADIVFTNQRSSKKRPVLVLWLDGPAAVVATVTSAAPRTLSDISLGDWRVGGLVVASTVRLSRLDCLEQQLLLFRIGSISKSDARRLKATWAKHIKPQF
jgi:mRNA interferase MazF